MVDELHAGGLLGTLLLSLPSSSAASALSTPSPSLDPRCFKVIVPTVVTNRFVVVVDEAS